MLTKILEFIGLRRRIFRGMQIAPWADPTFLLTPLKDKANLVRYQFHVSNPPTNGAEFLEAAKLEIPLLIDTLKLARSYRIRVAIALMTRPKDMSILGQFWQEVAKQIMANQLRSQVFGYDILNEPPMSASEWNNIVTNTVKQIREIDTRTPVIVSSVYGDPSNFRRLALVKDRRVIYTFHHYYPLEFTHQGIYEYPIGRRRPSLERLKANLKIARDWQNANAVRMYVGEFSCVRWTKPDDALTYLRDSLDIFEMYGWDWSYHAWKEWHGWDLEKNENRNDLSSYSTTPRKELIFEYLSKNTWD